jgi:hypothetical protein
VCTAIRALAERFSNIVHAYNYQYELKLSFLLIRKVYFLKVYSSDSIHHLAIKDRDVYLIEERVKQEI